MKFFQLRREISFAGICQVMDEKMSLFLQTCCNKYLKPSKEQRSGGGRCLYGAGGNCMEEAARKEISRNGDESNGLVRVKRRRKVSAASA